ncbi:MAG: NAD(P)/FAD-dependent oxidoreductase [Prolixibacteraceae bacterium]
MPVNIPETGASRVVIVGAGFAGLKLARKLKHKGFQLVLLDKNNYHQFQPLFYQVATSGLEPSAISFPLRKVFQKERNVFIRVSNVDRIFPEEKMVETRFGKVWYDYLVIATGATTNFFGVENFKKYGIPMKAVSESVYLRNTLLLNFEKAVTIRDPDQLKRMMHVVVVGGGPTGVEVCGALAEMRKFILPKDYPDLDFNLMQITLIEANTQLLNGMRRESGDRAKAYLGEMGIRVMSGCTVTGYDGKEVILNNGDVIQSETLIWAAGVLGQHPGGISEHAIGRGNRLVVNRFHEVEGYRDIFAIGDISLMTTEKYPNGHPQVAQVALQQADNLAHNLAGLQQQKELRPFEYRDKGSMATIGRNKAVVDLPFIHFSGTVAWLVWMFVHLMSIVGVKNRLLIFINWLWKYFTFDQSLRIILRPSQKAKERMLSGEV